MFPWPPMPLQPLDEGADRKLAHSDRLALPMMIAPAAFSRCAFINCSSCGIVVASTSMPASLVFVGLPARRIAAAAPVGAAAPDAASKRASRDVRRRERRSRLLIA